MPIMSSVIRRRIRTVFLMAQALLLAAIICTHAYNMWNVGSWIKFFAIGLCLSLSILYARRGGDRLMPLAMTFTLIADTFLVLRGRDYLTGVLFFCAVQAVYLVRIASVRGGNIWVLPRLVLFSLGLGFLVWIGGLTGASGVACFYITNFFVSIWMSLSLKGRQGRLFCAGLILFFCCDICVGLSNLAGTFSPGVQSFLHLVVWLFYLPGQALLVLSGEFPLEAEAEKSRGEFT